MLPRMALHRAGQADARHGCVESISGRMRDEFLNEIMFRNMFHARAVIRASAADRNERRPHPALGHHTPKAFAERLFTATVSHAAQSESPARLTAAPPGISTQRDPVPNG